MKKYIIAFAAITLSLTGCLKDLPYNTDPAPGPDITPTVTPAAVFINEISTGDKLFEIYNSETKEVDITGYTFVKDSKDSWTVPASLGKIPAGGFVVYKAKQTDPAEGAPFGLSGTKGFHLQLFLNADLETLVDEIDNLTSVTTVEDSETFGRLTDGASTWTVFTTGTMGAANAGGTPKGDVVPQGKVVLNELDGNNKFIELFNCGDADVDMAGWQMFKDGEADAKWIGPEGFVLKAGEYKALDCVKKSTAYATDFGAGFSAAKNVQIILLDAEGNEIDRFERGVADHGWGVDALPSQEYSFSRVPDGTGPFVYAESTKGAANGEKKGDIEQSE